MAFGAVAFVDFVAVAVAGATAFFPSWSWLAEKNIQKENGTMGWSSENEGKLYICSVAQALKLREIETK